MTAAARTIHERSGQRRRVVVIAAVEIGWLVFLAWLASGMT